jgi:redox-regulated HSP33 family molecular chaperone
MKTRHAAKATQYRVCFYDTGEPVGIHPTPALVRASLAEPTGTGAVLGNIVKEDGSLSVDLAQPGDMFTYSVYVEEV